VIQLRDGRTIGYAEFGDPQGTPVLWCHGGPGSRLESSTLGPAAAELGLRLIKVMPEMFAFGVQCYVDDRLADGPGWGTFDVSRDSPSKPQTWSS
jgi:hypothetical protein